LWRWGLIVALLVAVIVVSLWLGMRHAKLESR
jgi:hypothetical protein